MPRHYVISSWKRGMLVGVDVVSNQRVGRFRPDAEPWATGVMQFEELDHAIGVLRSLPEVTQGHCVVKRSPGIPEANWNTVYDGDDYEVGGEQDV